MNLREYLRKEWSQYIRPLMVKNKCGFCGCEEELHLHHIDRFHNLLVETLEELQLQELDTEFYGEFELKQISNFMLAKQLKSEYKTLCKTCHIKLHNKEKYSDEYKNHYYNPNGSYVQISKKLFEIDGLENNNLARFIKLCCNITYDGVLKINNRKVKFEDNMNEVLGGILNLERTDIYRFIEATKKYNLVFYNGFEIVVNKEFAQKGFIKENTVVKIFNDKYNQVYDSMTARKHKTLGNIIKAFNFDVYNYDKNFFSDKNITRFTNDINNLLGIAKVCNKKIIYNPNILYKGSLDYSYKNKIDEYEEEILNYEI